MRNSKEKDKAYAEKYFKNIKYMRIVINTSKPEDVEIQQFLYTKGVRGVSPYLKSLVLADMAKKKEKAMKENNPDESFSEE